MKVIGSMKYASTQVMGNTQMPTIGRYAVGAAHSAAMCSHSCWWCLIARLGWSTGKGELQAPVGYDAHSYAYRDVNGARVHRSARHFYGEPYGTTLHSCACECVRLLLTTCVRVMRRCKRCHWLLHPPPATWCCSHCRSHCATCSRNRYRNSNRNSNCHSKCHSR